MHLWHGYKDRTSCPGVVFVDLLEKVDRLRRMYGEMREAALGRGSQLEQTMGVSEKFWDDIQGLMGTLKDLQDTLASLEAPALDPRAIREQQDALEALRDDMDLCQTDVDQVSDKF